MAATITQVSTKTVYKNKWLSVREDEVILANGQPGIYSVLDRMHGAVVLPFSADGYVLLEQQWRYPIQDYSWEGAGGGMDNQSPRAAACRELYEEVGISITEDQLLDRGFYYPLNSCSTEKVWLFFVEVTREQLENARIDDHEGEGMNALAVISLDEAMEWIESGKITENGTMYALLRLWREWKLRGERG